MKVGVIRSEVLTEQIGKGQNRKKSGEDEVAVVRIDPRKRATGGKRGADLPAVAQRGGRWR